MCIRDRRRVHGLVQLLNLKSLLQPSRSKPINLRYETSIEKQGEIRKYEFMIILNSTDARIVLVMTDVTERTENIKLKEISEYKSRLMASVSHELRTPLNGNIAILESALDEERIPEQSKEEHIRPALDCSQYLLCIINDILDFSQLNAQVLTLTFSSCILSDVLEEALRLVRFGAKGKGLALDLQLDDFVPREIITDRNRLKQVLLNLLSNAVKFTYEGGIKLSVKRKQNDRIAFEVEDTGIGIKKEDYSKINKIFGKIRQDGSELMNPNGAGLGLMISNTLVQMLGGEDGILFDSEYGKGSRFWFEIPMETRRAPLIRPTRSMEEGTINSHHNLNKISKRETTKEQRVDSRSSSSFANMSTDQMEEFMSNVSRYKHRNSIQMINRRLSPRRIEKERLRVDDLETHECFDVLVVDDNEFNLHSLIKILKKIFHLRCDSAYNGLQCIQKVQKRASESVGCLHCAHQYKIIFMDCDMPVMDGLEATQELRGKIKEGSIRDMRILACTAYAFQSELNKCLQAGMDDVITKPISMAVLREKIEKWLV
eukprot:TRINITY_DN31026_c0_g1_i1.p1 TRINITY_DN31026_c0_g1~~TRINITY_DN31026_c0_g1_i1.p1  ORF type:complete len:563 (+),score=92.16 TRINITY_DN31026_c0_g1_i1:60-1691(+)